MLSAQLEQRRIFRWFFFVVFAFLLYQLLLILALFSDAIIWAVSLSLVFVPAVYSIMDDVARGSSWLMRKVLKPNAVDEPDMAIAYGHPVLIAQQNGPKKKPPLQIAAE